MNRQQLIAEEQDQLDKNIKEIEQVINTLRSNSRKVSHDPSARHVQKVNHERVYNYTQALDNPYIGRIDLIDGEKEESYYLGKTAITKDNVENIVLDWRAPIADLFYQFQGGDGRLTYFTGLENRDVIVTRKREIKIEKREVLRVSEKVNNDSLAGARETDLPVAAPFTDDFLHRYLEDTTGDYSLREIIATIQQEQHAIISTDINDIVLVQGAAGSGKSSVALHRISYLLYRHPSLQSKKILILAPNQMFLNYIQDILPELDIEDIEQLTFIDFSKKFLSEVKKVKEPYEYLSEELSEPIQKSPPLIITYKGSIQFKHAIDRYFDQLEEHFCPQQRITIFSTSTLDRDKIKEIYLGFRHLPLNKRREETIKSILTWMNDQAVLMRESIEEDFNSVCDRWVFHLPAQSKERKLLYQTLERIKEEKINALNQELRKASRNFVQSWKPLKLLEVYENILNVNMLKIIDPEFVQQLEKDDEHGELFNREHLGYEDLAPLLYINSRINHEHERYDYIVIDEAQDFSPFQFYFFQQISKSMTILGDITQSIFPYHGLTSWKQLTEEVWSGLPIKAFNLFTSYRSSYQIMELANLILENSSAKFPAIVPVNRQGKQPKLEEVINGRDLLKKIQLSIQAFTEKGYTKIAIITKDSIFAQALYNDLNKKMDALQLVLHADARLEEKVIIIPSFLVKGLEFDAVIIPNANKKLFDKSSLDTKLLFVSVTRAHHDLHLYYFGELSPLLDGYLDVDKVKEDRTLIDSLL